MNPQKSLLYTIRKTGAAVQHAHAADRFAREIDGFLTVCVARLQRLMGRPLGRRHHRRAT
jgi:hypothetical protein